MENENEFDFNNAVVESLQYLRNYAKRFGLQDVDEEELVSNTILKAFENRDKYKVVSGSKFRSWLTTIMTNIFINDYRSVSRKSTDLHDNQGIVLLHEQKAYLEETDSLSIYKEMLEQVKDALTEENYRIFIAYINGYQYNQIAEIFDIPIGTIKSKIFISRQQIMRHINGNKIQKRKYRQI